LPWKSADSLGKTLPVTTAVRTARTRLTPQARRAQLLDCALAAFAEHGVARATHSHVAERAGVSVPAVHSYFRTRDDLVAAVLGEVEVYLIEIVSRSLGGPKAVHEALEALAVNFSRDAKEKPDMMKVWLDWSTGVRADVWPRYMDVLERLHAIAQKVLERGMGEGVIPPDLSVKAAARVYLGGGHTVALMQFSGATPPEIDAVIGHLVRTAMGIGPGAPLPAAG
jgi:TetR/AcrR family hemagglutinin/protease transcriptional regulator